MKHESLGTTLMELLIALSLLSIFFTLVISLYVKGFHTFSKTRESVSNFRETSLAFEMMIRDLEQCEKIYSPTGGTITLTSMKEGYSPLLGENTPFIFVKFNSEKMSDEVIAYSLDKKNSTLTRMLYSPTFDPEDLSTWQMESMKAISKGVARCDLKLFSPQEVKMLNAQFLQVTLALSKNQNLTLETRLKLLGGF